MRPQQAAVLVGGLGRRLGALTAEQPKPMLEVAGQPFLGHVIANLTRFGISNILLLAGHGGEILRDYMAEWKFNAAQISVVIEPEPLGTGGAISFAADFLDEYFLLANGDTYFDADLVPLLNLAGDRDVDGAILLKEVPEGERYGRVSLSDSGQVDAFIEKNKMTAARSNLINAGTYLFEKKALLNAITERRCSLEHDVLPRLLRHGKLKGVIGQGRFIDIGIPESLKCARKHMLDWRRRPAAFLDRDGVLNYDEGYSHNPNQLIMMPEAALAVRLLNESQYYVIVVTNQAGIARGYFDSHDAFRFNCAIQKELMALGAHIDAFYFCPHHPEGNVPEYSIDCNCRKPKPGLLQMAAQDWPIVIGDSFLIGDSRTDLAAAHAFGVDAYLYSGGSLLSFIKSSVPSLANTGAQMKVKQPQQC